ncbi:RHS repeat-associated core domain-containing protein [Sungkyunkwania multivorans]|uniref:RHS repeat-associated core domain-containing protein n=1 Tax=Sungkyunkwania multivorans TaxID=1173618 RepID=A0ABW3D4Y4_9FLAO
MTIDNGAHNGTISYFYDAAGTKLQKVVSEGSSVTTTDYAGGFVYEKVDTYGGGPMGNTIGFPSLKFFHMPVGYVEPAGAGNAFTHVYQYKDHLGNVRLSFADDNGDGTIDAATEVREENNYYPFGLKHKGYNNVVVGRDHKFEFQGIEIEESLGYNMMEMEMRQFDPAIARWVVMDPVTHHDFSPYNAFDNNPLFWADPSGANSTVEWMEANGLNEDDVITVYQASDSNEGDNNGSGDENGEDPPPFYYNWQTNERLWFESREEAAAYWGNNSFVWAGADDRDLARTFGTMAEDGEKRIKRKIIESLPDGLSATGQFKAKLIFFEFQLGTGFYSGSWQEGLAGAYDFNFTSDFGLSADLDFQTNYYYSGRDNRAMRLDDFTGDEIGTSYSYKMFNAGVRQAYGQENPYQVYSLGTTINLKSVFIRWLPKTNNNVSVNGSKTGSFYKVWDID